MTLAEIIEEAERRQRICNTVVSLDEQIRAMRARDVFYLDHFPALLAVAKAAVEMRTKLSIRYFEDAACEQDHQWVLHDGLAEALATFDAAVRGEGKEKEG